MLLMYRQVAIALQVFHRVLPRPQRGDFRLQGGNLLDLVFQAGDLGFQEVVLAALAFDLGEVPGVHGAANQAADQGGNAKRGEKCFAPALARSFAVREQIDQNHCRNLRKARPQEVR
jgi:hypothetical protein